MAWIILGIYIIGVVISALVFPRLFPYEEGEWEMICGELMPVSEEEHKMNVSAMCFIWPLIWVLIVIIVLPIKSIECLCEVMWRSKK